MKAQSDLSTAQDVFSAREDLEFRIDAYLRTRGWKSTCNNPASLWLWERPLPDGRVLLTDKDTALAFERMTWSGDDSAGGE